MNESDTIRVRLHRVAHARSGDKGNRLNVSVIPYRPECFGPLLEQVTEDRVLALFAPRGATRAVRYELPRLPALNFVIDDVLGGGVNASLGVDGHGKTLSSLLLTLEVDVRESWQAEHDIMWFKNLIVFRLLEPFEHSPESLGEAMQANAFRPCGGLDPFTSGWDAPAGRLGSELVHAANGCTLVCMRREERLLPAAVVREELAERVARIEDHEHRTVRRKEQQRLRDEVVFDLLPRAFTRSQRTFAYIEPRNGWLVVDTSSARRAEELVILLADSLGHLAAEPFSTESSPDSVMTGWLANAGPPRGFAVLDECELRDPDEEGAQVKCRRQDLHGNEIRAHLQARKVVRQLALAFEERIAFLLDADLTVRRLRFDAARESDEHDGEDELARFDADFAYMTSEVNALVSRLATVFE